MAVPVPTFSFSVAEALPPAGTLRFGGLGEKDAVTVGGSPLTPRLTTPPNPLRLLTVTVVVAFCPGRALTVAGATLT